MCVVCQFCKALHWHAEARTEGSTYKPVFGTACCRKGAVVIEPFREPHPVIRDLLTGADHRSVVFLPNIRKYNNSLAFTSVSLTLDNRLGPQTSVYSLNIQGQLCHYQGTLHPQPGDRPRFAQLYIYDSTYATDVRREGARAEYGHELNNSLLRDLDEVLRHCSLHYQTYVTAEEYLRTNSQPDRRTVALDARMQLVYDGTQDERRYNLPVSDELAALIPDTVEGEYGRKSFRDVTLINRTTGANGRYHLDKIDPSNPSYMSLHYVLLFPYGDAGWHWNRRLRGREAPLDDDGVPNPDDPRCRVTQREYYRYVLNLRSGHFPQLHLSRRLFHQFILDAWVSVETAILDFIRRNQDELRTDSAAGLTDALNPTENLPASVDRLGKRIILPSSFSGSDRYMNQLYQDSMAIVREKGSPTLFITVTANPHWEEITRELMEGQDPKDRPDLIARVFAMKIKALLEELKKKEIFGPYRANCYTVEFQKRGLPHVHILLFLANHDRYKDPAFVDTVVKAHLIDPSDPSHAWAPDELSAILEKVQFHRPCGRDTPNSPCMKDGKCSKGFPKEYIEETEMTQDGYPLYARPRAGRTFTHKGKTVDNSWVVPYNPYLTLRYNCHINVEILVGVGAVKYIHKYAYKGADRATARLTGRSPDDDDEVAQYLNCRYVSPCESMLRIMECSMHEEWPPVQRLALHLPDQQFVTFPGSLTEHELAERVRTRVSTLMAFFEYNERNEDGRHLTYQRFPEFYVYDSTARRWHPRQRGEMIGRMYYCSPLAGERYYLRLLLTVIRGPRSFEDLRTVDGVVYPTFREACQALGMLESDSHWLETFEQAAAFKTGSALRTLFTVIIKFGTVTDLPALWHAFRHNICDDLPHRLRARNDYPSDLAEPHVDYGLYLVRQQLQKENVELANVNLPEPLWAGWHAVENNPLLSVHLNYDVDVERAQAEGITAQFNVGQRQAYERITGRIQDDPDNSHFFLQGAGGTGKTFLYRALCSSMRAQGKIVLCVASSGMAALLLPDGRTAHSTFKIPLDISEISMCDIKPLTHLGELMRKADLLIWDEVTMQHKHCFMAVHRSLCDVRRNGDTTYLFGGLPAVLGGDFAQILPVVPGGSRGTIVNSCVQYCEIWPRLEKLKLTDNMRLRAGGDSAAWAEWIHSLSYDPANHKMVDLPEYVRSTASDTQLLEHTFPTVEMRGARENPQFFDGRAVLCVTNEQTEEFNDRLLNMMTGDAREYISYNRIDESELGEETPPMMPDEMLLSMKPAALAPPVLQLKVGAPVMLLRNLCPREGLCNGTRMTIVRMTPRTLTVRVLGGDHDGSVHFIPRIDLKTKAEDTAVPLIRRQFPVRLCFAMTINKSQGQTLRIVGLNHRTSPFSHGQLYVALSRVLDVRNLMILLPDPGEGKEPVRKVNNIVYPEVLLP